MNGLWAALWKRTWGYWWMKIWTWADNVLLHTRKPTIFWAASKAVSPRDWGRRFCPSALLWWDLTWSTASSSGALSTGKTQTCWSGGGSHKNIVKKGTPLLWGKGEIVGFVQPREVEATGRPYWGLLILGAYKKDGERLFTKAWSNRTWRNYFKLKDGRFRLGIRKKFFMMRVVRHWNRLPREVVDTPPLEVFKVRLDGALSNLI